MAPSNDGLQQSGAKHIRVLDGFRGLAAYIVVISHATNATNLAGGLLGHGAGQIGVMLFFVLSGFLMGFLYLDRAFQKRSVWQFVVRRIARVVPLYYLVLTAAVLLLGVSQWLGRNVTVYPIEPYDLAYHYGFLYGVSVFWTIPIELQFYAAFLLLWWVHGKSPTACWIGAGCVMIVSLVFKMSLTATPTLLDYIAYFLAGLLISRILTKLQPRPLWTIAFIGAAGVSLLLFPGVYVQVFGKARWSDFDQMWHDPICLTAVSALLMTSLLAPLAKTLLGNRFMIHSGRISYSMYLLHLPIIVALVRFTPANQYPFVFLAVVLVLTFVVAAASFRWIEWPLRVFVGKAEYLRPPDGARRHAALS